VGPKECHLYFRRGDAVDQRTPLQGGRRFFDRRALPEIREKL
jgi:hypothetical protein